MKIFNIMCSRQLGGMEQAFLDYEEALKEQGAKVINIVSSRAKIATKMNTYISIPNLNSYDIISAIYLKFLTFYHRPDAVIVHGSRASRLFRLLNSKTKTIAIAHNYKIKYLKNCDYIIALTKHMRDHLIEEGVEERRIIIIPNMIRLNDKILESKELNAIEGNREIVIGSFGRFVDKKGFAILLQALKILKDQGHKFKAVIGGGGVEEQALQSLSVSLGLQDHIKFIGWVEDKAAFFKQIDIFCLPSLHEPFGIVILEAMAFGRPIIATRTEGPSEILINNVDGLLCDVDNAQDLATKMIQLINNPIQKLELVNNAYTNLQKNYDIKIIGTKLTQFIQEIIQK